MLRSPRFLLALLLLAALTTYLLGNNSVLLWDRDEPRYAQTSRQMLDSGDWVVPRLLDEKREKKPAGIYWCQAAAMAVLGENSFAARLPGALAISLTTLVLAVTLKIQEGCLPHPVRRERGGERVAFPASPEIEEPSPLPSPCVQGEGESHSIALWTAFIFATSGTVIAAAKMAITDGVLLLFITAAQLCFYRIINGKRRWARFLSWGCAQGCALLIKGPIGLAVCAMTALALLALQLMDRKHFSLSPLPGGEGRSEGRTSSETHDGHSLASLDPSPQPSPPKTGARGWLVFKCIVALAIAVLVFSPWWIAVEHRNPGWTSRTFSKELVNRAAEAQEGHRGPPGYYLLTIWATFLPWSVLLPFAAIHAWRNRFDPTIRFAIAAIIGPWILFELSATKLIHYLLPVYPALAYLVARWLIDRGSQRIRKTFVWIGSAVFVGVCIVYAGILPRIPELRLSKRLAEAVISVGATHPGDAQMIDYKETSLAFYQGGTIRPQGENNFLLTHPKDQWPMCLVITDAIWKRMPRDIQDQWDNIRTVHGWNLAGGDADRDTKRFWEQPVVDVHVLRKK